MSKLLSLPTAVWLLGMTAGALAGCAHRDLPPDTAVMSPAALGTNGDVDVRALDIAAFDFAHAIVGDPARAAIAIATLDYMGGELNSSPRWIDMDPLTRLQMLDWRKKMRAQIGISETAPAQAVVDTMLGLGQAYRTNDQAAVQKLLASPIFIVPPSVVAERLNNVPYNASLNNVTTRADGLLGGINSMD
jgi:hypothetical protein